MGESTHCAGGLTPLFRSSPRAARSGVRAVRACMLGCVLSVRPPSVESELLLLVCAG